MFKLSTTALKLHNVTRDVVKLSILALTKSFRFAVLGTIFSMMLPIIFLILWQSKSYHQQDGFTIAFALAILIYPASMSALLFHINSVAMGCNLSTREALKRGMVCLVPSLIGSGLYVIAVSFATIFFVIPGIIMSVMLCLWWAELVLDNKGLIESFKSSIHLTYSNWWRTWFATACIYGFIVLSFELGSTISDGLKYAKTSEGLQAVIELSYLILLLVVFPVFACANVVVTHHDMKLRSMQGQGGG